MIIKNHNIKNTNGVQIPRIIDGFAGDVLRVADYFGRLALVYVASFAADICFDLHEFMIF